MRCIWCQDGVSRGGGCDVLLAMLKVVFECHILGRMTRKIQKSTNLPKRPPKKAPQTQQAVP
jgi:hypothetical protein